MKAIFYFLSTCLILIACDSSTATSQSSQPTTEKEVKEMGAIVPDDWEVYETEDFSIQYPSDWTLQEKNQLGAAFFLFAPMEGQEDNFQENVNCMTQNLSGLNMDLDGFVELSETQIGQLITDAKIIKSERKTNEQGTYHHIVYSGKQGIYDLQYKQYYWVEDDKAVVLTFTGAAATWKSYTSISNQILNSFRVK